MLRLNCENIFCKLNSGKKHRIINIFFIWWRKRQITSLTAAFLVLWISFHSIKSSITGRRRFSGSRLFRGSPYCRNLFPKPSGHFQYFIIDNSNVPGLIVLRTFYTDRNICIIFIRHWVATDPWKEEIMTKGQRFLCAWVCLMPDWGSDSPDVWMSGAKLRNGEGNS